MMNASATPPKSAARKRPASTNGNHGAEPMVLVLDEESKDLIRGLTAAIVAQTASGAEIGHHLKDLAKNTSVIADVAEKVKFGLFKVAPWVLAALAFFYPKLFEFIKNFQVPQ